MLGASLLATPQGNRHSPSLAPPILSGLLWSAIGTAGGVVLGYTLGEAINRDNLETDTYNMNQAYAAGVVLIAPFVAGLGSSYGVERGGGVGNRRATMIASALIPYIPAVLIVMSVDQDAPGYNPHRQIVLPVALASAGAAWLVAVITDRVTTPREYW